MRAANVSPAELQQAKALLLHQITLSESSDDPVARGFVARSLVGLPLDDPNRAAERYFALTATMSAPLSKSGFGRTGLFKWFADLHRNSYPTSVRKQRSTK
jgi:hypothetical protein